MQYVVFIFGRALSGTGYTPAAIPVTVAANGGITIGTITKGQGNPDALVVDGTNSSIKAKFGITTSGTAGVTAAFNAPSTYIQAGGLSSPNNIIRLGDWIDLEGGLTVSAYGSGDYAGGFIASNQDLGGYGKLFRLIVVGINSFNGKNSNNTPHVVFQFQNIPVIRPMNRIATTWGGYQSSFMRRYLLNDTDYNSSVARISFLAGLKNAGVPEAVLWAPKRYVSARTTYNVAVDPVLIEDVLWLPTGREMFGPYYGKSIADETAGNQTRLEYYDYENYEVSAGFEDYNTRFMKWRKYAQSYGYWWYWEASQVGDQYNASKSFCGVFGGGHPWSYEVID
jgi:hypothetical protein